jgi:short-subunit dehydrogenase
MSKAAVRALSVSLRSELALDARQDVSVCTVLPATIDTPFYQHAANYTGRKPVAMPPVYTADRVAKTVLRAMRHPRREVVAGGVAAHLLMVQHKATPRGGTGHRPAGGQDPAPPQAHGHHIRKCP